MTSNDPSDRGRTPPLRLCADVNVFVADALARGAGRTGGASSRVLDLIRDGTCPLGPIQLIISWRMLTTLGNVLRREFMMQETDAARICDLIAAVAEFGPLSAPPYMILGGTGLLAMKDSEDAADVETALAGRATLLVTHDLNDFERGPKSGLRSEPIETGPGGKTTAIVIRHRLHGSLFAATPAVAIGWLSGSKPLPSGASQVFWPGAER